MPFFSTVYIKTRAFLNLLFTRILAKTCILMTVWVSALQMCVRKHYSTLKGGSCFKVYEVNEISLTTYGSSQNTHKMGKG